MLPDWIKKRLIDDYARAARLWSIRLSVVSAAFWSGVAGLYAVWPELASVVPATWLAVGAVGLSMALGIARVTKQPGLHDD